MSYNLKLGPVSVVAGSVLLAVFLFVLFLAIYFGFAALLAAVLCWAIGALWHPVPFLPVFAIVVVLGFLFGGK